MSGAVKLSRRHAETLRLLLEHVESASFRGEASELLPAERSAIAALRMVLARKQRKPKPLALPHAKPSRAERKQEKKSATQRKSEETAALRERALARANGFCECGCGQPLIDGHFLNRPEMDHAESRRVPQRLSNVWILVKTCHTDRTLNKDTPNWINRWLAHCDRYGYRAEAERARARLEGIVTLRKQAAEVSGVRR